MIPYSRQKIFSADIREINQVLKSDYLTQGPQLLNFEKQVSKKVKAKYCVGVNSATSALHIACLTLGVTKGDHVWTSTNTFVASANCAKLCGAKINLLDINLDTFNLDINNLKKKLDIAKKKNKLPKIIITVHFAGLASDQKDIHDLSKIYNFKIIEDASHSLGSFIGNEPVGSCKYSDMAVFSFHPVKNITTAEGGAVMTKSIKYYEKLLMFRNHGITKNKNKFIFKNNYPWYFEQQNLGYNYRMNEIQAILGIQQLKSLEIFLKKRNNIASRYNQRLDFTKFSCQKIPNGIFSAYHLYVILVKNAKLKDLKRIINNFSKKNYILQKHYIPIYKHPYYSDKFNSSDFPNMEKYYSQSISLPIFYDLKNNQQKEIINILNNIKI